MCRHALRRVGMVSWCLLVLLACVPGTVRAFGPPHYLPDGAHPRIWLTHTMIAALKAKKAANSADWRALEARCDYLIANYPASRSGDGYRRGFGSLNWPGGDGYAGSGYLEALAGLGVAYQTLKTAGYGTADAGPDDLKAAAYARYAREILEGMVAVFSAGEKQDGVLMIRMHDHKYSFNRDEAAKQKIGTSRFKDGYAARTTGMALPLAYDWFYEELSPSLRTTLYSIMFRLIDWYRNQRSPYNDGVLIQGVSYHEDKAGRCSDPAVWNTPNPGHPPDNCNIANSRSDQSYKQYGYAKDNIASNYFEAFAGMAMLVPLAVYGDAPQRDTDGYLGYARKLWREHYQKLSSDTGFKGGDSPEGIYYYSGWNFLFGGALGLKTATGYDPFAKLDFPKELARNVIHNTYSSLDRMVQRGSWSGNNPASVTAPSAWPLNIFSYILRCCYPDADEGKLLQGYLNTAKLYNEGDPWERFLWRADDAASRDFSGEPLFYRSIGTGVVTMRSSWSRTSNDTVLAQLILEGQFRADHEAQDEGQLLISRGKDRLLSRLRDVRSNDFEETAQGQNSIVFDDGGQGSQLQSVFNGLTDPPQHPPLDAPVIDRLENGASYLYVRGDVAPAFQWDKTRYPGRTGKVRMFYRNLLYLRPNRFVVFDVTRSNSRLSNKKSWYMQFEAWPAIDERNRLVTARVGASKIFVKGVYPVAGSYTVIDKSDCSDPLVSPTFYRVKYDPPQLQEHDRFLHVIEADAASSAGMAPAQLVQSADGRMLGTFIMDAANPVVAMFSADKEGRDLTGDATYVLPAWCGKSPWHFVAHLPPNTAYFVDRPASCHGPQIYRLTKRGKGERHVTTVQGMLRIAPGIVISSPVEGEEVSGRKRVAMAVPDTFHSSAARLYVDGVLFPAAPVGEDALELDTTRLSPGRHLIAVEAMDREMNSSLSAPVSISVVSEPLMHPADSPVAGGVMAP